MSKILFVAAVRAESAKTKFYIFSLHHLIRFMFGIVLKNFITEALTDV